jgi:hypothetical protein
MAQVGFTEHLQMLVLLEVPEDQVVVQVDMVDSLELTQPALETMVETAGALDGLLPQA